VALLKTRILSIKGVNLKFIDLWCNMSPWQFNSESQTLLSIIPQCIILGDPFQSCPEYVAFCIGVKWSYWSSILKIVTSDYIGLVLYYLVTCLSKLQFAKRYFHPSEESLKLPLSLLAYVNTILKYIRIYSSAELEPVYWHMVTRKLYTQALAAGTTSTHAHRS